MSMHCNGESWIATDSLQLQKLYESNFVYQQQATIREIIPKSQMHH